MGKSYKYIVAGHLFEVILPENISAQDYLAPYAPFTTDSEDEPLFTLRLEYADDLRALQPGTVKECLNDEAPYFWIFEKDGKFNFGFSYTKSHPDCILVPDQEYRNSTVYVPASRVERFTEFALSNAMMLLYTFRTSPYDTLMVHASVVDIRAALICSLAAAVRERALIAACGSRILQILIFSMMIILLSVSRVVR